MLRHAPWQLAALHSFAMVSFKAALHEPVFRDFRLALRGLAATSSLLSLAFVEDKSKRARMWRQRMIQIHGISIDLKKIIAAFRQPCSTYLLISAAYPDSSGKTKAPCFNTRKVLYVGRTTCSCHKRPDARIRKIKQLQSCQPVSCELALGRFHTQDNIDVHQHVLQHRGPISQREQASEIGTRGAAKWEQRGRNENPKVGTRIQKWDQRTNAVGRKNPKVGPEAQPSRKKESKSGNKNPNVGAKWEQSGDKKSNKAGPEEQQWDQRSNKVGTKWEQESKSVTRVGTKWAQESKSGTRRATKWEQEPKSERRSSKVGTKWEQESKSGARKATKWEQESKSGTRRAAKWKQEPKSGSKVGTRRATKPDQKSNSGTRKATK